MVLLVCYSPPRLVFLLLLYNFSYELFMVPLLQLLLNSVLRNAAVLRCVELSVPIRCTWYVKYAYGTVLSNPAGFHLGKEGV